MVARFFTMILALFAAASFVVSAEAQEQAGPSFAPGSMPSHGNTGYVMDLSEDKQAGIVMFDGIAEQLDGVGAPSFTARTFSIALPVEGAKPGDKVGVFLEGYAARLKGTDLSLITTVNGEPHVMDFAKLPASGIESEACKEFRQAEEP